jgi:probable HAF family extracellular repeat protein
MRSENPISVVAITLFAVLAAPAWLVAQEQKPARYTVIDLGTLSAGTSSMANGATNTGFIIGAAALPDGTQHAVLWQERLIRDIGMPGLGTPGLEAPNSEAFGVNESGQASGLAETSMSDPNGEDFCGFGTHVICLGFVWRDGVMTPLPTLGGNNAEAGQINNLGEVAGNAENSTPDSTCGPAAAPQKLQEKPVFWKNGEIKELPTFPGDPDGWAFGINDDGQVAGASGACSAINPDSGVYILSRHALLWDKGTVTDLGNLGGTGAGGPGNYALELNNQGQVVGVSDLKGDTYSHAFLWTRETGMQDLGTLPSDVNSAGLGINERGDVVGVSLDASGNPRAFLRENGGMTDLNTLIPVDSPLYLLAAHGINSLGEIVGFGATSTGDIHAFRAIPCDSNHAGTDSCIADTASPAIDGNETAVRPKVFLSENARELLRHALHFSRSGVLLMGPQ